MSVELIGSTWKKEELVTGKVLTFRDEINASYAWDCGEAIGGYLQDLKKGRLTGSKCAQCKRVMIPPRSFCELCFKKTDGKVILKDTGTINTFSICYITWDMKRITKPQIPAVIEIDGASPGMGILHLVETPEDLGKVRVGAKVKAVWKPASQRKGAITDIKYFRIIA